MKSFKNFKDALVEFRLSGGAMIYHCAIGRDKEMWQVGEHDEVSECISHEYTPRTTTEHALMCGGLTPNQVISELKDWQE